MNNICANYDTWRERSVISDCLVDLDMKSFSKVALMNNIESETVDSLIDIITTTAKRLERHDVLERLYFAGLTHG